MTRDPLVAQKISSIEIMVVLLLLLLPLLAVDLEVKTSRMPLLQMHTSSNSMMSCLKLRHNCSLVVDMVKVYTFSSV